MAGLWSIIWLTGLDCPEIENWTSQQWEWLINWSYLAVGVIQVCHLHFTHAQFNILEYCASWNVLCHHERMLLTYYSYGRYSLWMYKWSTNHINQDGTLEPVEADVGSTQADGGREHGVSVSGPGPGHQCNGGSQLLPWVHINLGNNCKVLQNLSEFSSI